MLRGTTACTFSTAQLPKVVQTWCVLYLFTWKCASRHNGVHFFDISTSKSGPNVACFVPFHWEMCFAPQRRAIFHLSSSHSAPAALASLLFNKSLEKHSVSRLSFLFAHLHLLFSDSFSSTLLSSNISLLSASSLLYFSSVHIVGSWTSKFPSNSSNNDNSIYIYILLLLLLLLLLFLLLYYTIAYHSINRIYVIIICELDIRYTIYIYI